MTSPEERREAQTKAAGDKLRAFGLYWPHYEHNARVALDGLLAYFDENEPAVADAIRYGFKEAVGRIDYSRGIPVTDDALREATTAFSRSTIPKAT
jgi:hypothetical protein